MNPNFVVLTKKIGRINPLGTKHPGSFLRIMESKAGECLALGPSVEVPDHLHAGACRSANTSESQRIARSEEAGRRLRVKIT